MLPAGFVEHVRSRRDSGSPVRGRTSSTLAPVEGPSARRLLTEARILLQPREDNKQCWRLWHALLLMVLVGFYGYTLSRIDSEREMLSASWREILGELHPDGPKSAERITESEVVPKWAEYLHADDVTKQLNWFQTFCFDKYGMDDHIGYSWLCNIVDVDISWKPELSPLDSNMNCSAAFINQHVIQGDDPRCVPFGAASLSNLYRLDEAQGNVHGQQAKNTSKVDSIYDEYTVRSGDPLWENMHEHFEEMDERLQEIAADLKNMPKRARLLKTKQKVSRRMEGNQACTGLQQGCQWFATDHVPEVPCHCFHRERNNEMILNACRNHHWGLVHLCKPSLIKVSFHIQRVVKTGVRSHSKPSGHIKRHKRRLYLEVEMSFETLQAALESPAGWYHCELKLSEGEFYGYKNFSDGVMCFATLCMLLFFLLRNLLGHLLFFPYRFRRILRLKDPDFADAAVRRMKERRQLGLESSTSTPSTSVGSRLTDNPALPEEKAIGVVNVFDKYCLLLVCGRGNRAKYMTLSEILLENTAAVCVIIGVLLSLFNWFFMKVPDDTGNFGLMTPSEYVKGVGGWKAVYDIIFYAFFDEMTFHGYAWMILYFRTIFCILSFLEGLRWLPVTIVLASVRSIYFMIAYGFLILGFASLAYIQFGARYVQFSSIKRASFELLLLSSSVQGHVFDDITPFQDRNSLLAGIYLAFYLILAVTIGLNFFTTILLDAYNLALDPAAADKVIEETSLHMYSAVMQWMGIQERSEVEEPPPPTIRISMARESHRSNVTSVSVPAEPPSPSFGSDFDPLSSSFRRKTLGAADGRQRRTIFW